MKFSHIHMPDMDLPHLHVPQLHIPHIHMPDEKTLIIGLSIAVIAAAAPAVANSFNFSIQGVVPGICEVTNDTIAATTTIDLDLTSAQAIGDLNYRCTNPAGFTRTISSQNNGQLVSGSQGIDYQVTHTGNGGLDFSNQQVNTPLVTNHAGDSVFASGETASISVTIPNLASDLFAGTYTDTITIDVTAN